MRRVGVILLALATIRHEIGLADGIEVEYGDCAGVLDRPACTVSDEGTLTLWVKAALGAGVEITIDGQSPRILEQTPAEPGTRYRIAVPAGGARELRVAAVEADTSSTWSLGLASESTPGYLKGVWTVLRDEARPRSDRRRDALRMLREALAAPAPERRGAALHLIGRIEQAQGHRGAAMQTLRAAIAASLKEGRRLEALRATNILASLLINDTRELEAVAPAYSRLNDDTEQAPAEQSFFSAYFAGWAASEAGDARDAVSRLSFARELSGRMGWVRRQLDADQALSIQLAQMGRRGEALELLQQWRTRGLPESLRPCEQANFLNNLAWPALLMLEAGEPASDPTDLLESALRVYRDEGCDRGRIANAELNLALAHYHHSRLIPARHALDRAQAETGAPELSLLLWWFDVAARVAETEGRLDEAGRHVDDLEELASRTLSPSARWRAAIARARLHEGIGELADAMAAYGKAEAILDSDIYRLSFDAGRELLIAGREAAVRRHLALLLAQNRVVDALRVARQHNARLLESVSVAPALDNPREDPRAQAMLVEYRSVRQSLARDVARSWVLARDERERLAAEQREREARARVLLDGVLPRRARVGIPDRRIAEGELLLAFQPLTQGWVGFAWDASGVRAETQICGEEQGAGEEVAACLLQRFAPAVRMAKRLTMITPAALQTVDFHALPFDGVPLISWLPVAYALDVGARARASPQQQRAVLVGDPRGDLLYARAELDIVQQYLDGEPGSWTVERLEGKRATSYELLPRLNGAAVFHFAGHAWHGGRGGWESELRLARKTTIGVRDILSLLHPPQLVVLSGCETGKASHGSIGLAQAFVVNGTDSVVAATRTVADDVATTMTERFYRALSSGRSPDAALRLAQLEFLESGSEADWAAFRVIGR